MPDSSVPGETEYIFKHNLEHDLVLRLISPDRARRFYRRAAEWLETRMPRDGQSGEQLEYLAALYEKGGESSRAAEVFFAAGDKARARYANGAAVELYERGLKLLGAEEALGRMDPLHNYGDVLQRSGRLGDALTAFNAMLDVAYRLDHVSKCAAALGRIARIHRARGEFDDAERHLTQALTLFRASGDIRGVAGVEDDYGRVAFLRGAYADAIERHARALDLRRALGDKRSIALSLHNLALAHQASGGHGQAMVRFQEALRLRAEILLELGDYRAAREAGRQALELADRLGSRSASALAHRVIGAVASRAGLTEEDVRAADLHFQRALDTLRTLGAELELARTYHWYARVLDRRGDRDSANQFSDQAGEITSRFMSISPQEDTDPTRMLPTEDADAGPQSGEP